MEQQENRRIEFIDLTKGLCIMLVVMMHVGGAFDGLATGPVLSSFTMPLYFFVSGLFFKSYEGFGGFLARKVDKLLVPFLIFYLGAFLLMYGISKAVPGTFRLPVRWNELLLIFRNHELIRFNPPIWFLVALFNCNMLFYVVHYLRRKHIPTMFAVTLLIGATGFWLGKQRIELPFYIDVAMTALPFYFAGFGVIIFSLSAPPFRQTYPAIHPGGSGHDVFHGHTAGYADQQLSGKFHPGLPGGFRRYFCHHAVV